LGVGLFEGQIQRRGTHVSTPEIGSRVGELCFGGISGIYADLRRELFWGEFEIGVFGVLLGVPTWGCEEGGHYCVFEGIYWSN
jgi:hypothetical protein